MKKYEFTQYMLTLNKKTPHYRDIQTAIIERKGKMKLEMTYEQYMELWVALYRNKVIPSNAVPRTKEDYDRKVNAIKDRGGFRNETTKS